MSLATFHIVFILASLLLALFAGAWGVSPYAADGSVVALTFGVLSLLAAPVLAIYGVKVRAKLRELDA